MHILPGVGIDNLKEGLHKFKCWVADNRHKSSWTGWQVGRAMTVLLRNHGRDLWAVELLVHTSFHLESVNAAHGP